MNAIMLVIAIVATVAGVGLFVRGVVALFRQISVGRPSPGRLERPGRRLVTTVTEILSHSGFKGRPAVRVAHWFVMISFVLLVPTLGVAYVQIVDPHAVLPLVGGWPPWQWAVEVFSWAGLIGIAVLFVIRLQHPSDPERPEDARDWRSRFYGSTRWQAYFVEAVIAGVILCVLSMHVMENALLRQHPDTTAAGSPLHFPTTYWLGTMLLGAPSSALELGISVAATLKILISMIWMIVVGRGVTMSVAWHRFLGVVNVFTRRDPDGGKSLGPAAPMLVDGKPFDIRDIDDLPDDASFGITTVDEFGWKPLLDFASCTECGRCQDMCPAWNTGKPLSPKLLILSLRDHAAAVATPHGESAPRSVHSDDLLLSLATAKAAGPDAGASAEVPLVGGVLAPEALWACTTCGACVDQCPVDIEHVDTILSLRQGEVMTKSEFPDEFGSLFQQLETRGNPWGLPAKNRLDWTRGLGFPVPVVGRDVESLTEVDYLLWVGCAGAFAEKGKATTRAVAELLHLAGVSFAILGDAESCSGDPARRAGNEATFQMLALQNIETMTELGVTKIVVSCAHCYNTLAREYEQFGAAFEVTHHTQVLNKLIRDKRLALAPPSKEDRVPLTYHDPCYLGRHNGEYDAPRELLTVLPGTDLVEMEHSRSTSMCCGAGGARMWAEESEGTRINEARLQEAVDTGAATVATACPYCTVMLTDAAAGAGREAPAVRDVALLLLDAVRRATPEPSPASAD